FVVSLGPVREAPSRQLPRRVRPACAFTFGMDPELFAGARIERKDGAAGAAGRIEDTVDDERRRFEKELGTRTEVVGPEAPGDFQGLEIRRVDLIERRVPGAAEIAAVGRPLSMRRARLRGDAGSRE